MNFYRNGIYFWSELLKNRYFISSFILISKMMPIRSFFIRRHNFEAVTNEITGFLTIVWCDWTMSQFRLSSFISTNWYLAQLASGDKFITYSQNSESQYFSKFYGNLCLIFFFLQNVIFVLVSDDKCDCSYYMWFFWLIEEQCPKVTIWKVCVLWLQDKSCPRPNSAT
jgi:hypothetical protein